MLPTTIFTIPKHIKTLDYLRGISALLVLLYHYTCRYNENSYIIESERFTDWPFSISWGGGAVVTFFLMSGFLLAKNIDADKYNVLSFLGKRLFRLYPTFWICLIITTLVLILLFPEINITLTEFIANITMLPSNIGYPDIDGAYWTLAYEIKFAVLFSMILCLKNNLRKLSLWIWIIGSILNSFWISNSEWHFKIIRVLFITDWAQIFICGICLRQIISLNYKFSSWYILLFLCFINQVFWKSFDTYTIFLIISLTVFLFLPYVEKIVVPDFIYKPIQFVAAISYPLYLLHQMIGFAIIRKLQIFGLKSEWWIFIPIGICTTIAFLVHKYIETPTAKASFSKCFPIFKS